MFVSKERVTRDGYLIAYEGEEMSEEEAARRGLLTEGRPSDGEPGPVADEPSEEASEENPEPEEKPAAKPKRKARGKAHEEE